MVTEILIRMVIMIEIGDGDLNKDGDYESDDGIVIHDDDDGCGESP